jgi:steroid delta-isomerase
MSHARFTQIAAWFQALTSESLGTVASIYAADAVFEDPFNTLRGIDSVQAVYQHMFDTLAQPRFIVTTIVAEGQQAFMTWDFHFTARAQPMKISGCTQFELNDQGLITLHRDYWDAAQQVYEKVPLLGAVLRLIRRKLALPTLT